MQTLKVARTFIWKTKEKHDVVYHSAKIQTAKLKRSATTVKNYGCI